MGSIGSVEHATEVVEPDPRPGDQRFVFCRLMTTDCTIGHQEKKPNTTSIGSANSRLRQPAAADPGAPATARAGRSTARRCRAAAGDRGDAGHRHRSHRSGPGRSGGTAGSGPRRRGSLGRAAPAPACSRSASRASMSAFLSVSTACTTGVEQRVDLLRGEAGSATSVWSKMTSVKPSSGRSGTLMYGSIQPWHSSYCSLLKIGSAGVPTGCFGLGAGSWRRPRPRPGRCSFAHVVPVDPLDGGGLLVRRSPWR